MRGSLLTLVLALAFVGTLAAGTFDTDVKAVLTNTCAPCHNQKLATAGLNVNAFLDPGTILTKREAWEAMLAKLRSGEMPPKGIRKPPLEPFIQFVQAEFDRADSKTKPDPGRVVSHRLNRNEYANT